MAVSPPFSCAAPEQDGNPCLADDEPQCLKLLLRVTLAPDWAWQRLYRAPACMALGNLSEHGQACRGRGFRYAQTMMTNDQWQGDLHHGK